MKHLNRIYITSLLLLLITNVVMGQENRVPVTITDSWPEAIWGTKQENMSNQIPNQRWAAENGYALLEYLQINETDDASDGKRSWIELPYTPNANTEIEIKYEAEYASDGNTEYLFGCGGLYEPSMSFGLIRQDSEDRFIYANGSYNKNTFSGFSAGIHRLICKSTSFQLDDEDPVAFGSSNTNAAHKLCLFYNPYVDWSGARCFKGKIYSVKISEDSKLLYDLVPCKNGTGDDARCGFYDKVNRKFYGFFELVNYVENTTQDNIHVKIPLAPEPDAGYEWTNSLVHNGHFETSTISSSFHTNNVTTSIVDESGTKAMKIECPAKDTTYPEVYNRQMCIKFDEPLYESDVYYVSFYYKAENNASIPTQAHYLPGQFNHDEMLGNIDFTTSWQHYEQKMTVTAAQASDEYGNPRPFQSIAFNLNVLDKDNTYYITNVTVRKQSHISTNSIPSATINYQWTENLVTNGNLETDNLTSFTVSGTGVTRRNVYIKGANALEVVSGNGTEDYSSQLYVALDDEIKAGEKFVLSFDYMAEANADIRVYMQGTGSQQGFTTLSCGTNWKHVDFTGTITEGIKRNLSFHLNVLRSSNKYYFTNIVVKKEEEAHDPGKIWSDNLVVNNASSFSGTPSTDVHINYNGSEVEVTCPNIGANSDPWESIFEVKLQEKLDANEKYQISFAYKVADGVHANNVNMVLIGSGSAQYKPINFTDSYQPYELKDVYASDITRLTFNLNLNKNNLGVDEEDFPSSTDIPKWTFYFKDFVVKKQIDDPNTPVEDPMPDSGYKWSKSLVKNGYFSSEDLSSFSAWPNTGTTATSLSIVDGHDGGKAIEVTSKLTSGNHWDSTFSIALNDEIEEGEQYYITFDYKADKNATIYTAFNDNDGQQIRWNPISLSQATTDWQTYRSGKLTYGETKALKSLVFLLNESNSVTSFYFTNIVIKKMVPKDENNSVATKLSIDFKNLYNGGNEWTSNRHLFSLGTHEDGTMALNTLQGLYRFVSGQTINVTTLASENSTNPLDSRIKHSAIFTTDKCTIDGVDYNVSGNQTWNDPDALYLMGTHCDPNPMHSDGVVPKSIYGQIFHATLTDNGIVLCDLQPARNANGTFGFYDKLTGTFYTPDGCTTGDNNKLNGYKTQNSKNIDIVETPSFYVEMKTPTPIVPKKFLIGTYDKGWQSRVNNPKTWKLYAKNEGDSDWTEISLGIRKPNFSAMTTDTEYYLYNVETGTFFVNGNPNGTRATVSSTETPLKVKVVSNGSNYELQDYYDSAWKNIYANNTSEIWIDQQWYDWNNWVVKSSTDGIDNVYEISVNGKDGLLGLYSDIINDYSDNKMYRSTSTLCNKWAFVTQSDYNTFIDNSASSVTTPIIAGQALPDNTNNWFEVNTTTPYSMYRLEVYDVGDSGTSTVLNLRELALTADYTFEHYEGPVYANSVADDTDIPDYLRWGPNSTYPSMWKAKKNNATWTNDKIITLQRTHEYVHEVYVLPGNTVNLAPFSDFISTDRYEEEYIRWYDYKTDTPSQYISFTPVNGQNVVSLPQGLFAWRNEAMTFRSHEGAEAKYWARYTDEVVLDSIALEASINYSTSTMTWAGGKIKIKEPDLQWRHIFVLKNARSRADEMSASEAANTNYINSHKLKLMCPAGTPFQYPLPCYEYATNNGTNPTDFYYLDNSSKYQPVYHYKIVTKRSGSADIETTIATSTSSIAHGAYSFKENGGFNRVFYLKEPEVGTYTIQIFALDASMNVINIKDTQTPFKIMEYELQVLPKSDGVMVTEAELTSDSYAYKNQRPTSMEKILGSPTTVIDFDEVDSRYIAQEDGGTYVTFPRKWEESSYGFAFEYPKTERGDYSMYMIIDNSNVPQYHSFNDVKDRLSIDSKGESNGYYYYCNAASDPGRMAVLDIGNNFCTNTKVYVSAWINELQNGKDFSEAANVIFSFRGVDREGNETLINSFVTGYVPGGWNTPYGYDKENFITNHSSTNPDCRGQWMHVYYTFEPEVPSGSTFDHFIITLENNATSSMGADYAIDDIRAYVCQAQMNGRLLQPVCNNSISTGIELYGIFDRLKKAFFPTEESNTIVNIDYCIIDRDKFDEKMLASYSNNSIDKTTYPTLQDWIDKAPKGTGAEYTIEYQKAFEEAKIKNVYGGSNVWYGTMPINSTHTNNNGTNGYPTAETVDGVEMITLPCTVGDTQLRPGKRYSIALLKSTGSTRATTDFEIGGRCSYVSTFTVPKPSIVKIDGMIQSEQDGLSFCANQLPVVQVDLNGVGIGGVKVTSNNIFFDWYQGPLTDKDGYDGYEVINKDGLLLKDALLQFRTVNVTATNKDEVNATGTTSEFTQAMKDYIIDMLDKGVIALNQHNGVMSTKEQYQQPNRSKFYISAIPVNPNPDPSVIFCEEPIEICTNLNPHQPSMKDGDDQGVIPYPTAMRDVPLRIGLKQLKRAVINDLNATTATNRLYVPLREVTPSTSGVKLLVQKPHDDYVYLAASNDPNILAGTSGAVDILDDNVNKIYSDLKVVGKLLNITADMDKHGVAYDHANEATNPGNICHLAFLKDFKFREGYWYTLKFHFEENYSGIPGDHSDICPGDVIFTVKVVPEYQMWTGEYSRNWNDDRNWKRVTKADLLWGSKDSAFLTANADYITDGGTNDNTFSYAPADFTKVIIPAGTKYTPYMYEMRDGSNKVNVNFTGAPTRTDYLKKTAADRSTFESAKNKEIGLATDLVKFDMASVERSATKNGDIACRTWYDHTCDQIHFNAGAEIMDQRYIYYNKAWCDIDVPVGTWQTVSSPLMNIVAGDLYLPTATARQQTPLFEDIYYDTDLNDRFKPAVYQRSWNKGGKATVYKLDGSNTNVGVDLDWSHVYNDVNVQYGAGVGFSAKVDISTMTATGQDKASNNLGAISIGLAEAYATGATINLSVANGQYLYGSNAQNCAVGDATAASASTNAVAGYKVEMENGYYLFRCVTPAGGDYGVYGKNPCYLNSQPSPTGVTFNLGKDQDVVGGSSWMLMPNGSLKNVGSGGYFNGTNMSNDPVKVSFVTVKNSIPAKFRFPKADKQYTYYNPGNTDGEKKTENVNATDIVNGVRPGKLSDLSATFQQEVGGDAQVGTSYFLVGNPLMCWLDMNKFFENTDNGNLFEKKYWIVTSEGQHAATYDTTNSAWVSTKITNPQFLPPGVSFFLQKKEGATTVTPKFTEVMMSYTQGEQRDATSQSPQEPGIGNATEDNNDPAYNGSQNGYDNPSNSKPMARSTVGEETTSTLPQLRLTAEAQNGRKSVAVLTDGTLTKDAKVETLFDSNLRDDIFIYTTKYGQAMTITDVAPGDTLPLIISGAEKDIQLHIKGAYSIETPLYIYDTETGEKYPLDEDITLQQSQNGVKYYILADPTAIEQEEVSTVIPHLSVDGNLLTISLSGDGNMNAVRIYTVGGITVAQEYNVGNTFSITLPSKIYIVDVEIEGKRYTYKIAIL